MRKRKIRNACGINSSAMDELTAGVTKKMHKKKKFNNEKRKRKASNRINFNDTPQPVEILASAMEEYVDMVEDDDDAEEPADDDDGVVEEVNDGQDQMVDDMSDGLDDIEDDFDE